MRAIKMVIKTRKVDMGGIILDQPLPYPGVEQIDPFLLIHHFEDYLPGDQDQKDLGVGPHPHRGFSPVTFIFEGEVHHRDSRGNEGIVSKGGTQWMDSGMGIVHSERPSQEMAERGGSYEIIQFWVNSPSSAKGNQPKYYALNDADTVKVETRDPKVEVGIVSGNLKNHKGSIPTNSGVLSLRMNFKSGGRWLTNIPEDYNTIIYLLDGQMRINGKEVIGKNLVWFVNEGEIIELEAIEDTRAILLAGEPLNEKMVHHGPFVMNSETEIMEALRDYQMGKMGILIEEFEKKRY